MNNTALTTYNNYNLQAVTAGALAAASFSCDYMTLFLDGYKETEEDPGKTYTAYKKNLRQFAAWLHFEGIKQPVKDDMRKYRQFLTTEHDQITLDPEAPEGWSYKTDGRGNVPKITCRANTAAQYLRTVAQFFKWCAQNGLYPNITDGVKKIKTKSNEHRREAFTAAEVLSIEEQIKVDAAKKAEAVKEAQKDTAGKIQRTDEQGKRLFAMYLLTVTAGLRTIEVSRADVKDFITRGGASWLYIWGKGHEEADTRKPLAPEVAEALRDYLASRTDNPKANSPLFVATGNRSGGKRLAATTISTMLKRAMQAAGYDSETLTAHSLRHTAGTAVQEITGNIYATQKYMRHSNPATTEIYLHNETEKEEKGIAQKLYNLYHGIEETDSRAKLEQIIDRLTPEKLAQLAGIAESMA